jgi:hypothetical protein
MAHDTAERATNQDRSPRAPEQIEAELERTRDDLARTIDEIADRVSPRNVARRAAGTVRAQFVDDDGRVRVARLSVMAVSVAAIVALAVRRRRH